MVDSNGRNTNCGWNMNVSTTFFYLELCCDGAM